MEKKTVKLTNFVKIQEDLNKLADEYKIAKENNNEEELVNINEKYAQLKVLLRSNAHYFNQLDENSINEKITNETDNIEKGHLKAKIAEKSVYKTNESYITMVDNTKNLDDYIENTTKKEEVVINKKKRNFVKKHFKKLAIGAAAVMLMGSFVGCFNKSKTTKGYTTEVSINEQETTQEPVITEDDTQEITTESLNELVDSKDEVKINTKDGIKLNPLEEGPKDKENASKKDNVKYTDKVKVGGSKVVGGSAAPSTTGASTTTKALDPHTSQKEAEVKKSTTTTTTIKQESVKEPEAVDYPVNIIDNTNVNKKEVVTYEYKEEKTNINNNSNMPIVEQPVVEPEKQPVQEPITEEEIIIYEENIEQDELYDGDLIDERSKNDSYTLSYRMI
ncbi:MAG: hypothetical protein IJ105_05955 [Bacilli bacterium]|nr:hypothetical protein [Bacilli bacterium]